MSQAARYRFGPLEKRGFLFGLTSRQIAILGAGAAAAILVVHFGSDGLHVALAAIVIALAVGACFWQIEERTLDTWLPLAWTHTIRRAQGRHQYFNVAPLVGSTRRLDPASSLPPVLRDITMLAAPVNGGELGVVKNAGTSTYAGVLSVRGRSFALLDDDAKQRLLAQWADVLAGLAREGSPVSRLQWIEKTVPETGDAIAEHLREGMTVAADSLPATSYRQLIQAAGPATQQHETYVVLQIDAKKARRAIHQAGDGDQGACAVLARELYSLANRLQGAELDVVGMLPPRMLAQTIRTAFDPRSRMATAVLNRTHPEQAGDSPSLAWPQALETQWHYLRTDSGYHATYWIAEWPRIDVGPDFLAPLLLQTWMERTVSVTIEPVPPLRAQREVEHARTSDVADRELREKHGFLSSRRREREQENVLRREQELADGHADIRFSGYVTVTAASEEELEAACGQIEQQAAQSRLVLRRMVGEQDLAFTYTLPLCRGLR